MEEEEGEEDRVSFSLPPCLRGLCYPPFGKKKKKQTTKKTNHMASQQLTIPSSTGDGQTQVIIVPVPSEKGQGGGSILLWFFLAVCAVTAFWGYLRYVRRRDPSPTSPDKEPPTSDDSGTKNSREDEEEMLTYIAVRSTN